MISEAEANTLEEIIRRMTDKQRDGLECWLSDYYHAQRHPGDPFPSDEPCGPLWASVKRAQEFVHWFERPEAERAGLARSFSFD